MLPIFFAIFALVFCHHDDSERDIIIRVLVPVNWSKDLCKGIQNLTNSTIDTGNLDIDEQLVDIWTICFQNFDLLNLTSSENSTIDQSNSDDFDDFEPMETYGNDYGYRHRPRYNTHHHHGHGHGYHHHHHHGHGHGYHHHHHGHHHGHGGSHW